MAMTLSQIKSGMTFRVVTGEHAGKNMVRTTTNFGQMVRCVDASGNVHSIGGNKQVKRVVLLTTLIGK